MKKWISEDKNIKLVNENALDVLNLMIEKEVKVDCIITDPPYKITSRGNEGNSGGMLKKKEVKNGKVFKFNDLEIEDWLPKLYNVLKDCGHCYIMTNNKNITKYLKTIDEMYFNDNKNDKFHFIKNLIWVKDNKIMGHSYMSQFEYIIFLRKGAHKRINDCGTSDVLSFKNKKSKDNDGKTIHDTEKPVDLMEILIKNSTNENDLIFDPFAGTFSVAVACKNLKRKFIGCELEEKYYNLGIERIDKHD